MKITQSTKISFGAHKGTKIRDLSDQYLKWVSENLFNSEFHDWAIAAKTELKKRKSENINVKSLEQQADDILRSYGIDPNNCG